jgi:hypothetical protein
MTVTLALAGDSGRAMATLCRIRAIPTPLTTADLSPLYRSGWW